MDAFALLLVIFCTDPEGAKGLMKSTYFRLISSAVIVYHLYWILIFADAGLRGERVRECLHYGLDNIICRGEYYGVHGKLHGENDAFWMGIWALLSILSAGSVLADACNVNFRPPTRTVSSITLTQAIEAVAHSSIWLAVKRQIPSSASISRAWTAFKKFTIAAVAFAFAAGIWTATVAIPNSYFVLKVVINMLREQWDMPVAALVNEVVDSNAIPEPEPEPKLEPEPEQEPVATGIKSDQNQVLSHAAEYKAQSPLLLQPNSFLDGSTGARSNDEQKVGVDAVSVNDTTLQQALPTHFEDSREPSSQATATPHAMNGPPTLSDESEPESRPKGKRSRMWIDFGMTAKKPSNDDDTDDSSDDHHEDSKGKTSATTSTSVRFRERERQTSPAVTKSVQEQPSRPGLGLEPAAPSTHALDYNVPNLAHLYSSQPRREQDGRRERPERSRDEQRQRRNAKRLHRLKQRLQQQVQQDERRLQQVEHGLQQEKQLLGDQEQRLRDKEQLLQFHEQRLEPRRQRVQQDKKIVQTEEQRVEEKAQRLQDTEQRLQEEKQRLQYEEQRLQREEQRLRQREQNVQEEEQRLQQIRQTLQLEQQQCLEHEPQQQRPLEDEQQQQRLLEHEHEQQRLLGHEQQQQSQQQADDSQDQRQALIQLTRDVIPGADLAPPHEIRRFVQQLYEAGMATAFEQDPTNYNWTVTFRASQIGADVASFRDFLRAGEQRPFNQNPAVPEDTQVPDVPPIPQAGANEAQQQLNGDPNETSNNGNRNSATVDDSGDAGAMDWLTAAEFEQTQNSERPNASAGTGAIDPVAQTDLAQVQAQLHQGLAEGHGDISDDDDWERDSYVPGAATRRQLDVQAERNTRVSWRNLGPEDRPEDPLDTADPDDDW